LRPVEGDMLMMEAPQWGDGKIIDVTTKKTASTLKFL
jgi:hypothetical protein